MFIQLTFRSEDKKIDRKMYEEMDILKVRGCVNRNPSQFIYGPKLTGIPHLGPVLHLQICCSKFIHQDQRQIFWKRSNVLTIIFSSKHIKNHLGTFQALPGNLGQLTLFMLSFNIGHQA